MKKIDIRNLINKNALRREKNLYLVEPLLTTAISWTKLSDAIKKENGKDLNLVELKGKTSYAKYVRKKNRNYWKMYIEDHGNVNIVYVDAVALNPIRQK